MCSRVIVKFYYIKIYSLQMNNANMLTHFYGYIKARENVLVTVSQP